MIIDDDTPLTREEAEKMLGVKKTSFYGMVKNGIIPKPRKRGKLSVWPLGAIKKVQNMDIGSLSKN